MDSGDRNSIPRGILYFGTCSHRSATSVEYDYRGGCFQLRALDISFIRLAGPRCLAIVKVALLLRGCLLTHHFSQ
jgi:hypothetical protein